MTVEDVMKALDSGEPFNTQLIPEEFWKTLLGGEDPKPEKLICVICGERAGSMRKENEGWYCNSSEKNCWGTIYEEDTAWLYHNLITVTCPFCDIIHSFVDNVEAKGTCGCGAEFYEGYDEIMHFQRRKDGLHKN